MNHAKLYDPSNEDVKKLNELIRDAKVAMFTVIDADGDLHTCPMSSLEREFDGNLWFFTLKSADKVEAINRSNVVSVSYMNLDDDAYVSVSGHAELVDDVVLARSLWSPDLKVLFPLGVEDPNLSLIRVRVTSAEYWESPSSWMRRLLDFANIAAPPISIFNPNSMGDGKLLGADPA